MKKIQTLALNIVSSLTFISILIPSSHAAAPVSKARAAELALHRIENLVILKKIQPTHVARLRSLGLTLLTRAIEDDPAYLVTASQYPAADGSQSIVQIPMKIDGKTLKQVESLGSEPVQAPIWPNLDAVTLAENSLHCLQGEKLDNQRPDLCSNPEITAYGNEFSSLVLSQETSPSGPIAVIDIRANNKNPVLRIRLQADGIPTHENPISLIQE
jgi:hypothetical protein